MKSSGARDRLPGAVALPVLHSPYELEPGPHRVHGGDLHVNELVCEADLTDHVLREITCHTGCLLGPGDPQHSGRRERALERREATLELALRVREELNEVERAGDGRPARHPLRQLAEEAIVTAGRIENRDRPAILDAELLHQRLPGVPSHLAALAALAALCCLLPPLVHHPPDRPGRV